MLPRRGAIGSVSNSHLQAQGPGSIPLSIPGVDKALNCTPNDDSRLSPEEINSAAGAPS
jgi:hypothetical protein